MKKILFSALISAIFYTPTMAQIKYPDTKKTNQVDTYFTVPIADPYRWLEDDTSAATAAWVAEQNKVTNAYLGQIPFREKLKQRLTKLWNYTKYGAPHKEGKYLIFSKNDGLQNQSVVYYQEGANGSPQVLLDPNKLSADGTVALQELSFSKNQRYVGYAVSASGSDWQEVYIMDFPSMKLRAEKLSYVKFTSISWVGDDGFYYSGYDAPKNEELKYSASTEYQKIFYHKLGTQQSEDLLIYQDREHPKRYVGAQVTEDDRFLVLNISEGTDGTELKVRNLKNGQKDFTTIVPGFATNAQIIDNVGDRLLMMTNDAAPNYKVVSLSPDKPAEWATIIPEQSEPLATASTGGGQLFCSYLKDASSFIVQYGLDGKKVREISLPGIGTAGGFGAKKGDRDFYYSYTSYIYPPTIFHYDIASGKSTVYNKPELDINLDDFVTEQVFFESNGTKVPMFLSYRKGLEKNGNNPVLQYGYGGFNISLTPSFSIANLAYMEAGGIYAVVSLHGGAEYGEEWHKAGMLANKQQVFDDFINASKFLCEQKYTQARRIAINGGSNGGLLVGATLTQAPQLYGAAVPQVGVLDMLRFHKFTVGWGWVVEYGSSDDKDQFAYLLKYSPLHNVKQGTCYPATLITTADHDDRVVPAHSFKFAATLQAAQGCDKPTLIRIDSKAGHGAGKPTSKRIEEAADVLSFIMYNTGMKP